MRDFGSDQVSVTADHHDQDLRMVRLGGGMVQHAGSGDVAPMAGDEVADTLEQMPDCPDCGALPTIRTVMSSDARSVGGSG
jgi:hypothetical protein